MPMRPPAGFISAFYDPLKVPDAPTIGTATGGAIDSGEISVAFTAPSNVGGSAITAYYAVSNPGQITGTGTSSPVTVSGLSLGTSYTFQVWALNSYGPSPYSAASGSAEPTGSRGVFGGGNSNNVIDYVTIPTTGNATDFGDLTSSSRQTGTGASSTRGIFGGVSTAVTTGDPIDYITIATTGNAASFGLLTQARLNLTGCSSSTRCLFAGGLWFNGSSTQTVNTIDYVTIATTGNATDFGDLTLTTYYNAGCSSPTRGVFAGGDNLSVATNVISYVTIATTGNATDFGDLTAARSSLAGCSNSTRGIFGAGGSTNVIQYITIASTGDATDFGDLIISTNSPGACANTTRGVFGGGTGPSNVIQYITIASAGNATDFGDLTVARSECSGLSNAHGGL